ncbi:MAG TPA: hypothetical protein VEU96_06640 [Bryobacteraceae bacterium]|nr:hypothetical protein [Bryobacteraceae bacterium]
MRYLPVFLLFAVSLPAQTVLQLIPEVITECTSPLLGREHVVWNYPGPGPVQIRLGAADGIPMTSFTRPQNSADTGDWVRDGLIFVLVDATGQELARATAHVRCNPFPDPVPAALAASSYFPLQVGNEWAYSVNSRIGTADHQIRRVSGVRLIDDQAWYVVVTTPGAEALFRADDQGRIYTVDFSGRPVLYLDPTAQPDPSATLKVLFRGQRFSSAIGSFSDSLTYNAIFGNLLNETGTYVRGVGLVSSADSMMSGSSGGFSSSLTLLYARIGGHIRFATPAVTLGLSVESTDLDVSGQHVSNCAVPCYFVACGLVPGADPPGTYKPCFETRVRLENLPVQSSTTVDLSLLDASNQSVFQISANVAAGQAQPDSILIQQLPLYTAPNQPLAPGLYRVQAKTKLSDGAEAATAIIPIQVR